MAEETMEISFDRNPDGMQDDIDIDLDLAAPQSDEDDILDDAEPANDDQAIQDSEVGVQQAFNTDDLMIDDEGASYTMNDAEPQPDTDANDVNIVAMPSASPEIAQTNGSVEVEELKMLEEVSALVEINDTAVNSIETLSHPRNEDSGDAIATPKAFPTDFEIAQNSGQAQGMSETMTGDDASRNMISEEQLSYDDSQDESEHSVAAVQTFLTSHDRSIFEEAANSIAQDEGVIGEVNVAETSTDQEYSFAEPTEAAPHRVIIHYDTKIFPLVRTSTDQSSDDFFFEDYGCTALTLCDLIKEFRGILKGDFEGDQYDYELCMFVEELGLEIIEPRSREAPTTSATTPSKSFLLENVTLSQLLDLHRTLQKNDGVVAPEPMVILLSIRLCFQKRLEALMEGAAAGQGLSELVACEGSQLSDLTLDPEEVAPGHNGIDEPQMEQDTEVHDTTNAIDQTTMDPKDPSIPTVHHGDNVSNVLEAEDIASMKNKVSDEEDLIDYEDEDEDDHHDISLQENGTDDVHHESISNHQLEQRLSIVGDEASVTLHDAGEDSATGYADQGPLDGEKEAGEAIKQVDYEEDEHHEHEGDYKHQEEWNEDEYYMEGKHLVESANVPAPDQFDNTNDQAYDETDSAKAQPTGIAETSIGENGETVAREELQVKEIGNEGLADAGQFEEAYDFDDFEDHEEAINAEQDHNEHDQGDFQKTDQHPARVEAATEEDLLTNSEVDISNHEADADENTTNGLEVAQQGLGEEDDSVLLASSEVKDEIDYEDDDDDTLAEEPSTITTPTINGSGKRARADEDYSVDEDERSKEVKRVRA